jgi:hypothetical protein
MTAGLFYGGIGSRSTPPDILTLMTLMTTIDLILVDANITSVRVRQEFQPGHRGREMASWVDEHKR